VSESIVHGLGGLAIEVARLAGLRRVDAIQPDALPVNSIVSPSMIEATPARSAPRSTEGIAACGAAG
jgi:hypothetical protein